MATFRHNTGRDVLKMQSFLDILWRLFLESNIKNTTVITAVGPGLKCDHVKSGSHNGAIFIHTHYIMTWQGNNSQVKARYMCVCT